MIRSKRARSKTIKEKYTPKKRISKKLANGARKKASTRKAIASIRNRPKSTGSRGQGVDVLFAQEEVRKHSGELSGDLQGLPEVDHPNSESLHELIEEGNSFEANVLAGVEDAEDNEGKEVHTHELPEDDVPGEYMDED
jgi:hypothetical protein